MWEKEGKEDVRLMKNARKRQIDETRKVLDSKYDERLFIFMQKTAYEVSAGLVGSEICIRDRY